MIAPIAMNKTANSFSFQVARLANSHHRRIANPQTIGPMNVMITVTKLSSGIDGRTNFLIHVTTTKLSAGHSRNVRDLSTVDSPVDSFSADFIICFPYRNVGIEYV